jgi:trehalose 6-phosphate phosphatase
LTPQGLVEVIFFDFFNDRIPAPILTTAGGRAVPSPLLLWNHLETLLQRCVVHEGCVLLLDYDGTLAPIVEDPVAAQVSPALQYVLTALAQHPRYRVGIISGRALADLRMRVEGRGLYLAGNHGLEIEGPGIRYEHPKAWQLRPRLDALVQAITGDLEAIPGAWVEDKGLTLSVHFRRVPAARVPEVKTRLIKHVGPDIDAGRVALRTGKAVLEIRPRVQWNKGEAVRWILEQIRLERPADSRLALYLGDDDTDEDAFRILASAGVGIVVGNDRHGSAAPFYVESPAEVEQLLTVLSTLSWPAA